ncbi:MAG TPA: DUF2105 domain-containing protein [Caldithrix abyssi]|uniref:DUF2105 domain-containing protein n=1 Tax=Caldithrix abyssi TaxID=187145 RepID=A0A7V5RQ96_CALAY|nr:DUF2105 domain-containing protein [Caldithrix abyssi]
MVRKTIALALMSGLAFILAFILGDWSPMERLSGVAYDYVTRGAADLGAMNLVTAIVVTYRGLDTLGEVTVLFLAASGVAVLLRRTEGEQQESAAPKRAASEIVTTGASLLSPFIVMFGAYIFLNGHLSPGGGFQGGAVIASAVLLLFLAHPDYKLRHNVLNIIESFSGFTYVLVGLLGLFLAGGFLDNRFLPLGTYGTILSAGAIPLIYTLIGLKVGTELAGILENMKGRA